MTGDSPTRFGATDPTALRTVRDTMLAVEPFVETTAFDDTIDPQFCRITLGDGVGDASRCRFDVRWSIDGWYSVHHTDDTGRDFRFDRHPKPDAPTAHFHPPPDAGEQVRESCLVVTEPELVTRAVCKLWRRAYDDGSLDGVNHATHPP